MLAPNDVKLSDRKPKKDPRPDVPTKEEVLAAERRALHELVQREPDLTQDVKELRLLTLHALRELQKKKSAANKPPPPRGGRPKS